MPKLVQPAKDSDDEPQRSEGNRSSQEEDDTSSDSDSSDGDGQNQHANKKSNAHQVLPSLGDELNHAKCIQDLSFFKLNCAVGLTLFVALFNFDKYSKEVFYILLSM